MQLGTWLPAGAPARTRDVGHVELLVLQHAPQLAQVPAPGHLRVGAKLLLSTPLLLHTEAARHAPPAKHTSKHLATSASTGHPPSRSLTFGSNSEQGVSAP